MKLFKQDQQILDGISRALDACKIRPMNAFDVSKIAKMSPATAGNYLKRLAEGDNPYLSTEVLRVGIYKRFSIHYTAIRDSYDVSEYEPVNVRRTNSARLNGTLKNMINKIAKDDEIGETPSHITVVKMRHISAPRKTEYRGIGSSMGMTW